MLSHTTLHDAQASQRGMWYTLNRLQSSRSLRTQPMLLVVIIIIIMLPNQAIASTPSAIMLLVVRC
jgi:hypothetical protein